MDVLRWTAREQDSFFLFKICLAIKNIGGGEGEWKGGGEWEEEVN